MGALQLLFKFIYQTDVFTIQAMQNIIISSFSSGILFLLSLILVSNFTGANRAANKWMSLFVFSGSCAYLGYAEHGLNLTLEAILELNRFMIAPALYLSVLHYASADRKQHKHEYLHFLPALLFFVFQIPTLLQTFGIPVYLSNYIHLEQPISNALALVMHYIIVVQILVYWLLSYNILIRHQNNIQLFNSSTDTVDLNWLKNALLAVIFMVLIWFPINIFNLQYLSHFISLLNLAAIVMISWFSIRQNEIYPFENLEVAEINEIITEEQKDKKLKRIPDEQIEAHKVKLIVLMEMEKLFLDSELSLMQLAKIMNLSAHELSYLLNEGFGQNFFHFVNSFRIEEAKRLLLSKSHEHLSVIGIAFESGFNSKTTFNTTFKGVIGSSPTEYRKTLLKQDVNAKPKPDSSLK